MRIGIVNDLRLAVESLRRTVALIPGATVAWVAEDGAQAVELCARDRPDVVLMDMIMPVMDGVEATRRIMRASPCPILVVTATVEGNAGKVFEALGAGALDAVATPGLSPDGGVVNGEPLVRKVQTIALLAGVGSGTAHPAPHAPAPAAGLHPPCVAIGASTGGPEALSTILRMVPHPAPWPIVIVQHIDAAFAHGLAEWLLRATGHRVQAASPGATPAPGMVYIAGGDDHVTIDPAGRFRFSADPRELLYRPSVDVFFESLATTVSPAVAVLLTGMGRDGAAGLASLRAAGWLTIAQDKATSVVWGMPGAAVELGAAVRTLPVGAIGPEVVSGMTARPRRPGWTQA